MPRVSVCIPSYNHDRYVAGTIHSVLNQTYQDFEIIITDDGSIDNTVAEIQKIQDPRIQLFTFAKNQGACIAANHCIRNATGEYIGVLSSDDEYFPHKLDTQVRFLDEHPDIGAVFSYAHIIDQDGHDASDDHPYNKLFTQENRTRFEWLYYFFTQSNCLCHPSILIRKACYDKVGLFDPRLRQLPDFDLWVRLCAHYEIHIIPEKLIKFRVHQNETNASGRNPKALTRLPLEFLQVLNHYLEPEYIQQFPQIFAATAKKIPDFQPDLVPFYLAMIALQVGQIPNKLFGLQTLYELLKDEAIVHKLEQHCNFSYASFFDLVSQYDLFRMVEIGSINYVPPRWVNAVEADNSLEQPATIDWLAQLTPITLILFPDWTKAEELLHDSLVKALRLVITHPDADQVTLLVYAEGVDEADVDLALSGALLSLTVEAELEIETDPQIIIVGALENAQWQRLAPRLTARIASDADDHTAIAAAGLGTLPVCNAMNP